MAQIKNVKALMIAAVIGVVAVARASAQGVCPSYIPPFAGQVNLFEGMDSTEFDWVISPTNISRETPSGELPCRGGGFIEQFIPENRCTASLSHIAQAATPTANGCTYTFTDRQMYVATVTLTCGSSSALAIDGSAYISSLPNGQYALAFTGSVSAVCPAGPPSPPANNFALTQVVCSDPVCSQNCSVNQVPQGQCEPVPAGAGASAVVTCASANSVTSQLFPQSATCSGPAVTTTTPTGLCVSGEDGMYIASFCSPAQSAAQGPFLRRPKRH